MIKENQLSMVNYKNWVKISLTDESGFWILRQSRELCYLGQVNTGNEFQFLTITFSHIPREKGVLLQSHTRNILVISFLRSYYLLLQKCHRKKITNQTVHNMM